MQQLPCRCDPRGTQFFRELTVQNDGMDTVNRATDTIHEAKEQVREFVGDTVDYIRENDFKGMMKDFTGYLKSHPGQALIGAVVVGFVAGRLVRRG